eukprot:CAMPEP_0202024614 /NCGR_PEP_ID=MMETSP0905-20130828/54502_1 /ASSEMBLY_ACC=CAM_ASM_000554 /TAXON_ID=420261 /ORGANISM="Thalassiosira antarctica, Strain CCMP982" /LENGTH=64 /DNA_ID=CAMNT_0048587299 /DNA_START=97 /DNA_END=291 /DNA_ORIENTATION=-
MREPSASAFFGRPSSASANLGADSLVEGAAVAELYLGFRSIPPPPLVDEGRGRFLPAAAPSSNS